MTTNKTNYEMINNFNENDEYPEFLESVKKRFNSIVKAGVKLFTTDVSDLFDVYLNNIPEQIRHVYVCTSCRNFINKYAGLVTISEKGEIESPLWDEKEVPSFFFNAVKSMKGKVLKARVNGIFLPDEKRLGIPKTGEWSHLAVELPKEMTNRSVLLNAHQAMAEKKEQYGTFSRALASYSSNGIAPFSIETVDKALALINSESLYRGDKVKGNAEWLKDILVKREAITNSRQRENFVWLVVASAPSGFTKRSSTFGSLLEDIAEGMSTPLIAARFKEKMDPDKHMRSQSGPSAAAILEAERTLQKLAEAGVASAESLQRRYAKFDEIPSFIWQSKEVQKPVEPKATGVFGHLTPKGNTPTSSGRMDLPTTVMTWEKFQRTVLPTAESIEALVDNASRFMALLTADDETAPNILQWNNPFSWYYHGGIDGEIKRRVEEAGGRYLNNEIRVSLIWEGYTDLDLHCRTPRREHIYYSDKKGSCGGWLDLDMNGLDERSEKPVENMRWANDAPEGIYKFSVHNFSERTNGLLGTPFRVELEIGGQVYHYNGAPLRNKQEVTVFEFDYKKGQVPTLITSSQSQSVSHSIDESWGVQPNSFVKVKGITESPNLWDEQPILHSGTHVFFLLDGVKDSSEGKGRGFFNEMLKTELRGIRRTLEAFTENATIQGAEEANACGVGYTKDNSWDLTLRVTSGSSTRLIKIDRWD